jgi:hypothetical protein
LVLLIYQIGPVSGTLTTGIGETKAGIVSKYLEHIGIKMSYDIWLTIKTEEDKEITIAEIGSYTSNVCPMWTMALGFSLSALNNSIASTVIFQLDNAVEVMRANPKIYKKLNPTNKWGNYEGAIEYLEKLLHECRKHPKAKIVISS